MTLVLAASAWLRIDLSRGRATLGLASWDPPEGEAARVGQAA
jgi:hypothetical protein